MKNCEGLIFSNHDWSKWEPYQQPMTYGRRIGEYLGQGVESRQKRVCLKCGKTQDEKI